MSLSQNIKRLRTQRGLTQEQLAQLLGISAQAISKWETSETYPDGALLVPLARALHVSLDELFDNSVNSMRDVSVRIRALLAEKTDREQYSMMRDLCWQIEKGLFNCRRETELWGQDGYHPEEFRTQKNSSYRLTDDGFTHVSNAAAPFFLLVPDDGTGASEVIGDGELLHRAFAVLGDRDILRAALYLHRKAAGYSFDVGFLARACEIPAQQMERVMEGLQVLHLVRRREVVVNGTPCTLYASMPSHLFIALLLIAQEMHYTGGYRYQTHLRSTALLKNEYNE
ncbi:MAG: helix-turn-helix transcriptional regulator [Clostridia bacterium]|nr:helix-turn-helix transcriptional regulator [Clostridia bacterium]